MNKSLALCLAWSLTVSSLPGQGAKEFKFEIETLGGQKLDQDDFKNNLLIVDLWGTWCGPCRQAIPGMVKLYNKYKHHGLEIIGLNYEEKGDTEKVLATIRDFAAANGIAYPLAIGTAAIKKQVDFDGYPTVLFFDKGMKIDHLETGFSPDHFEKMEAWVRKELGLGEIVAASDPEEEDKGENETKGEKKNKKKGKKLQLADGVIFRPGNHDTGFDFAVKGLDGEEIEFADFRGKKLILVLTSTWDREATKTAATLNKLHGLYADKGIAVLAASLGLKRDRESQLTAIQDFRARVQAKYSIIPVGMKFWKKIHQPSGLPLFLVFDEKGRLILRKRNTAAEDGVLKAVDQAVGSAG